MEYIFTRNLKKGMRGEDVKALQELLNLRGYSAGKEDGIFGSGTRDAVKRAQKANSLTQDGIAGRKTITALGGTWGAYPPEEIAVCSFNVKRGTYGKGTYKIIGEIIKAADIAGIQEVTPSGLNKIARYAEKTGYMCETIPGYGHAALTNYSVESEEAITLTGGGEKRKLFHMQIGDISYYNTHLHYTKADNNAQMKQIADILGRDKSKTVILTGDFNRRVFDGLEKTGFIAANKGQSIKNTEGGSSKVNKIDQIFVKGGLITDVWQYEAVKHKYSDHDALFARIRLGI